MGENNSNESLQTKYDALILLKGDEKRLEKITKLLEILSIEMGTIASDKAEGLAEDVKLKMDALKSKMATLKPQLEALKPQLLEALKNKATTTAFGIVSGYGSVVTKVSSIFGQNPTTTSAKGGKRIAHTAHAAHAYKSNGDKVHLLIDNKRLHRSVYVKGNGKAKYCKINNEFVLLSKLKNKIINI